MYRTIRDVYVGAVVDAMEATGADQAYIATIEEDRFSIKYSQGDDDERFRALKADEGIAGIAVAAKRTISCFDAANDRNFPYVESSNRVCQEIVSPIILREAVHGVILVDSFSKKFRRATSSVLESVALGVAQEMESMLVSSPSILERSVSPEFYDLCRETVEQALDKIGGDQAYLALKDDLHRMNIEHSIGDDEERFLSLTIHDGIVGNVVRTGESYLSTNVGRESFYIQSSRRVVQEVVAALKEDGETIGVLLVDSFRPDVFDERTLLKINRIAVRFVNAYRFIQVPEDVSLSLRRATMKRHFARHEIDELIAEEGKTELRMRKCSVLFADVRNFTGTCSQLATRIDLVEIFLREYYCEMMDAVHKYHGVLDKFIGDGVLALFFENGNHDAAADARNAIDAALEMQQRFGRLRKVLAQRVRGEIGIRLNVQLGCAVHSGDAVIGLMETAFRTDMAAIGSVVNAAAKIESAYKDDKIRISGVTRELVDGQYDLEELGGVAIGDADWPVYAVHGRRRRAYRRAE